MSSPHELSSLRRQPFKRQRLGGDQAAKRARQRPRRNPTCGEPERWAGINAAPSHRRAVAAGLRRYCLTAVPLRKPPVVAPSDSANTAVPPSVLTSPANCEVPPTQPWDWVLDVTVACNAPVAKMS